MIDASGSPPPAQLSKDTGFEFGDAPDEPGKLLHEPLWTEGPDGQEIPLTQAHALVAGAAVDLWEAGEDIFRPDREQWKVNVSRRAGLAAAKLRAGDNDYYEFFVPRGATPDTTPNVNKQAQLCRRFTSIMFADPPAPEVKPAPGEDADEDKATQAQRILEDLQSKKRLNTVARAEEAVDLANDFGSGFTHTYIDPRGGGRRPIEIEAHPLAQTVADALIDPMTGLEVEASELLTKRYVRQDGSLTDEIAEAATRWTPDLRKEVLTGRNVRPIPNVATWLHDCDGVQVARIVPLRTARRMFADLFEQLTQEEITALIDDLPLDADDIVDPGCRLDDMRAHQSIEERPVFILRTYMLADSPGYEDGLDLFTIGRRWVGYRESWVYTSETGERRRLPIPLSAYSEFKEGRQSFYKVGLSEIVGGGNVARTQIISQFLDHLDKLNHQKILLPYTSMLTPEQMHDRTGTVLYFNPGGDPVFPPVPQFSRDGFAGIEMLGRELDTASGLMETAQSLNSSTVESGRHALAVVAQAQAGLSEPRNAVVEAYERDCYIELELARAFLTVPQQLAWQAEGGRHKMMRWIGADISTAIDVRMDPTRMSLLTQAAKINLNMQHYSMGLISRDDMLSLLRSQKSGIVFLQDDPFRNRIRAQIAEHEEGPPDGWQPLIDTATGLPPMQPQQDPATGQTVMVPVPDPTLSRIWRPILCDMLPQVAQIRLDALARYMSRPKYLTFPPEWIQPVEQEYARMIGAVQAAAAAQQQKPTGEGGEKESADSRDIRNAQKGGFPS